MDNRMTKNLIAIVLSLVFIRTEASAKTVDQYEIYPKPQKISYQAQSFTISKTVNVVFEKGIDVYTKNRLKKILKKHKLKFKSSKKISSKRSNIIVGINKSKGVVDKYFNSRVSHKESFFDKTDSHIVSVKKNVIAVLGDDTDSAFYGITTLKHVFNQLKKKKIREFRVDDYSDVKHRGFIEGYYGNPWSNEDRAELMKFGGDYKLNTYFFAPKDDPYHNSKWRELYPEKELAAIKKLAKVGNETKNKYVYALHTFMHRAIRFDNESNYQNDLNVIKAKFTQLLQNDVRAFSILADDAGVPSQGPSTYVKLLTDLTNWLIDQKKNYPDLVTDIPFCPNDYGGNGSSTQLRETNKAPESVSIIMTGGRIWGEVSQYFTSNFIKNIASQGYEGRASYLWINWPCSDNSRQHLIMGGNDTFLHPGVTPSNIQGIILNPMQQAEANKSALFAIADYSWNVWDKKAEADQNLYDSFKYMNHGTAKETKASTALRTISKHMINQNMDGRVRVLQESVELAPKLNAFKEKLKSGRIKKEDCSDLIKEFQLLQDAAAYYEQHAGNKRTKKQIIHWLKCWNDTCTASISYLKCIEAVIDKDNDAIWNHFSTAQAAFEKSKTHKFLYVSHYEHAEVGVQHIVPFIKTMGKHLNNIVSEIVSPESSSSQKYSVTASHSDSIAIRMGGGVDGIVDGNIERGPSFARNPYNGPKRDRIPLGAFVKVELKKAVKIGEISFVQAKGDKINKAALEYSIDGESWQLLKTFDNGQSTVKYDASGLHQRVKFLRLRNLAETRKWWNVRDFTVSSPDQSKTLSVFTNTTNQFDVEGNAEQAKLLSSTSISLEPKQYIGLKLDRIKDLKSIKNISSENLTLQISKNAVEWEKVQEGKLADARYIRLINKTNSSVNFKLKQFEVNSNEVQAFSQVKAHAKTYNKSQPGQAFDGNFNSTVFYDRGFSTGDSILFDFGQVLQVDNLKYVVLDSDFDHVRDAKFQLSLDGKTWVDAFETKRKSNNGDAKPQDNGYKHGSLSKGVIPISHAYLEGSDLNSKARYFRILATGTYHQRWVRISEILINNGKYIKPSNNPTFVSTPIELKNHAPEKMFDGDLTSSYRPNSNNGKIKKGFITYKLSYTTKVSKINIVQNGNAISNAKVMVRVGDKSWQELGSLDKSLNEFTNTKFKNIFEIKIIWKDVAPTLYEIVIIPKK